MKQKIRTGVFESNSSSSHVITLSKDTKNFFMDLSMVPDPDGEINIEGGEFGWEVEKYDDASTKANYAAEFAKNNVSYLNMLRDVIQEQTQAKVVNINPSGYIDHQSDSVASVAFVNKESLRNFIFNKNSILFTSNDNGGGEISGKLEQNADKLYFVSNLTGYLYFKIDDIGIMDPRPTYGNTLLILIGKKLTERYLSR